MTSSPVADLIAVLNDVRGLLLLPGNDFVWSRWEDANAAVSEIDGLRHLLSDGQLPPWRDMSILFAPTGSIQEVSMSSGWGDEYLAVAERFDRASAKVYGHAAW